VIGRHDNRGALRLRAVSSGISVPPRRRLAPSLLTALVAHALLVAGLMAWRLPVWSSPLSRIEPVSATITFTGMRESDGSGGSPYAGGRGGGSGNAHKTKAEVREVASVVPLRPTLEGPPLPVIGVRTMRPVVAVARVDVPSPGTMTMGMGARPSFAGEGDGNGMGTGDGHGAGNGIGDGIGNGFAPGVAGSGNGSGLGRPDYLRSPQPRYPAQARQNGWEGTTILRVEVLADGVTGRIEVVQSSGYRILDEAAIAAVREARFQPARLEGVAIVSWVEVPITFRLNRG